MRDAGSWPEIGDSEGERRVAGEGRLRTAKSGGMCGGGGREVRAEMAEREQEGEGVGRKGSISTPILLRKVLTKVRFLENVVSALNQHKIKR